MYPFRAMAVVPGNSLRPQDYPVRRIPISTLCYGYAPFPVTAIRSTLTFVSTVAGPFVFEPPSRDLSRITSTRILRCLVLAESEGDPPRTNERTKIAIEKRVRRGWKSNDRGLLTWTSAMFVAECTFPPKWEGTWFQSGVRQPIVISRNELSSKGRCLHNEGDKFLLVDQ